MLRVCVVCVQWRSCIFCRWTRCQENIYCSFYAGRILSFGIVAFVQIPDEILLHLSDRLLVTRSPRTVLPKDKEGECVCVDWSYWNRMVSPLLVPRGFFLFRLPWLYLQCLFYCLNLTAVHLLIHAAVNILLIFSLPSLFRRIFHVNLCTSSSTWSILPALTFWSKSVHVIM